MTEILRQNSETIRNWGLFVLAFVGSILALYTFLSNIKQRKLENTFRLIEFTRRNISADAIATIITLFHKNNPLAGHPDTFIHENGTAEPLVYMFSEGGSGNGDVHNALEVFNLVSRSLNTKSVLTDLVWYEYGQLMTIIFNWVDHIEKHRDGRKTTDRPWPDFTKFMERNKPHFKAPQKVYTYAE